MLSLYEATLTQAVPDAAVGVEGIVVEAIVGKDKELGMAELLLF